MPGADTQECALQLLPRPLSWHTLHWGAPHAQGRTAGARGLGPSTLAWGWAVWVVTAERCPVVGTAPSRLEQQLPLKPPLPSGPTQSPARGASESPGCTVGAACWEKVVLGPLGRGLLGGGPAAFYPVEGRVPVAEAWSRLSAPVTPWYLWRPPWSPLPTLVLPQPHRCSHRGAAESGRSRDVTAVRSSLRVRLARRGC